MNDTLPEDGRSNAAIVIGAVQKINRLVVCEDGSPLKALLDCLSDGDLSAFCTLLASDLTFTVDGVRFTLDCSSAGGFQKSVDALEQLLASSKQKKEVFRATLGIFSSIPHQVLTRFMKLNDLLEALMMDADMGMPGAFDAFRTDNPNGIDLTLADGLRITLDLDPRTLIGACERLVPILMPQVTNIRHSTASAAVGAVDQSAQEILNNNPNLSTHINDLIRLASTYGLADLDKRDLLLAWLPEKVRTSLKVVNIPAKQLISDVMGLLEESLRDKVYHLKGWIENAMRVTDYMPGAEDFFRNLDVQIGGLLKAYGVA